MTAPAPKDLKLSPTQMTILSTLRAAHPGHASTQDLIAAVYGAKSDGGPISAVTTVQTAVSDLRRRLVGTGWHIPKAKPHRGRWGLYRLEKIAGGKR